MRLKSLELVGFKSFLEPTSITFAPGVTTVVGPNGGGKSNLVDAIRWVLGEQAPTRLRGKSAEDLIYAGNDANPAAGMAEVTLILEAADGSRLPEPYATFSEVAVTRRVFRDSDSEYLINKIPCRLKDITEFFMASQIYSRGYALIEQGRIEEIIQAKPEELRGLVEEAAGLSLFKGRRELSERKLERVKENLARLDDVLAEIERQLNYARRQARKAESYKIIRAELSELERLAAAHRIIDQRATLAEAAARESELRAAADESRARLNASRTDFEAATAAAQSARAEHAGAERELESLRAGAAARARTRDFLERRLMALEADEPAIAARIAELDAKAALARAARASAAARLARERASAAGAGGETSAAELEARVEEATRALKDAERRAEELKDEVSELIREAAVIRGRLGDLAGQRGELEQRLGAASSDAPAEAAEAERARDRVRAAGERFEVCRAEIAALEVAHRQSLEREIEVRAALEHLAARIAALKESLGMPGGAEYSNRDGASAPARLRRVLESLNGDGPPREPAMVSQVVRAPHELHPALHAVLGDELEAVIVESPEFAVRAIEVLKETRGGRLSFVQEPDAALAAHPAIDAPGIAGRLVDRLNVDARYAPIAELLLGHVMLADDLRSALAASNLNGAGTLFVTRDGDVVMPGRMIAGGSPDDGRASANDGKAAAGSRLAELSRAENEHGAASARLAELRAARERAHAALEDARRRMRAADSALSAARADIARIEQSHALSESHLGAARRRLGEIAETVGASNARLEELAHAENDARARLRARAAEIAALRTHTEQLGAALLEAASHAEARRAELAALEREHAHAAGAAADLEAQIDERRLSLERSRTERIEFERERTELAGQDAATRARDTELAAAIERLAAESARLDAELEHKRAALNEAQDALAALEADAVECGLTRERARTLAAELARGFAEKFGAEFDSLAAELVPALAGRDRAADDQRSAELRGKAERIGEVNLAAESEVKELDERAQVLNTERADLKRAVDDLTQTITRLNKEARKRFAETFEGAAKNFAELFPKLLRGGKGRLELSEATDMLEAGVNILIQPAGKKVKEIGLLSGGEKALSAMALVFSLFLLNPSPFCVMDEVDAPLDEFSLAQFTSLLGELKQQSQFIVITHNQRTMQRADQIHGVTMDRPGISKVISLKIPAAA